MPKCQRFYKKKRRHAQKMSFIYCIQSCSEKWINSLVNQQKTGQERKLKNVGFFQVLKCEILLFFSVLHYSKLNIFCFWTVGQTKSDVMKKLWVFFTVYQTLYRLNCVSTGFKSWLGPFCGVCMFSSWVSSGLPHH